MAAKFPRTVTAQTNLNGIVTDLVVTDFDNKLFISVTQFGKIGSLVLVRRDVNLNEDSLPVFSVKSLLGNDQAEYHFFARHLYETLQLKKQLLFCFALHSFLKRDLELIEQFIVKTFSTL